MPQAAVGLELLVGEDLPRQRVVREAAVAVVERAQVPAQVLGERGLGVDEPGLVAVRVAHLAEHGEIGAVRAVAGHGRGGIQRDVGAELAARQRDRPADVGGGAVGVGAGVEAEDLGAAPPQELDEAEVLPVPAVGEVDEPALGEGEPADRLPQHVQRPRLPPPLDDRRPQPARRVSGGSGRASKLGWRGLRTQTPRRTFVSAISSRSGGNVNRPISGASAAPDTAMIDGRVSAVPFGPRDSSNRVVSW